MKQPTRCLICRCKLTLQNTGSANDAICKDCMDPKPEIKPAWGQKQGGSR